MAKAMQGFKLPPEVSLMPDGAFLSRRRQPADADALSSAIAARDQGSDPEDLFKVTQLVKGDDAALPVDETGCKMTWPS